jgi:hypothetical protein
MDLRIHTQDSRRPRAGFDGDGGYPATVQLADGRLLTAYYARKTPRHDGYHMATVAWKPR